MKKTLNRRDFLKLAGLFSASYAVPQIMVSPSRPLETASGENVLIVVFDAFSASNISLHGYSRGTTPNIDRLAERATVYHNHFAGANFTTPGTASLLTGTLPWTHRAVTYNDTVLDAYRDKNIFTAFPGYHRLAYSHNTLVNTLLKQFRDNIEDFTPRDKLFLDSDGLVNTLFGDDEDIASISWVRAIKRREEGYAYSLFLSRLYELFKDLKVKNMEVTFPRGLPFINLDNYYILEQSIDWLQASAAAAPQPFLAYYHFLPPHYPYKTRADFYGAFTGDGYQQPDKPYHFFTQEKSLAQLLEWRTWYDEFILYADAEFGRLFDFLESAGLLENTWLVLTSDHGEMFERGISGHRPPVFYQPMIRIPLMIFAPGQRSRQDVYDKTSAIDLLPTLLRVTGQKIPDWIEGRVLPPHRKSETSPKRQIYAVYAKGTEKDLPITQGTVMLLRDQYKLMYSFGFPQIGGEGEWIELYDLEDDPEELNNLVRSRRGAANALLEMAKAKLDEVNRPYN
jgi:arylsulfatase A-like enzyme